LEGLMFNKEFRDLIAAVLRALERFKEMDEASRKEILKRVAECTKELEQYLVWEDHASP